MGSQVAKGGKTMIMAINSSTQAMKGMAAK
jgi:hypothetical protein